VQLDSCGLFCQGMAQQLGPMYLLEIAPFNLKGAFGTACQLFCTIGIFTGGVFGLREILGKNMTNVLHCNVIVIMFYYPLRHSHRCWHVDIAAVMGRAFSRMCLFVHALTGKRLEL